MRVYCSEAHRAHDPAVEVELGTAIAIYEKPDRAERIRDALRADDRFEPVAPTDHGDAPIVAVHDPGLLAYLSSAWAELRPSAARDELVPDVILHAAMREGMGDAREPRTPLGRIGHWCWETTTPIVAGTYGAARAAVDIALSALDAVLAGDAAAYGLCRPPGHHAPRAAFGGYCYFNNAAITAEAARAAGVATVAIIDIDYHHGNGTQQLFYDRPDVGYGSVHADPLDAYPFWCGHADEDGTGRGRGATVNVPLPVSSRDEQTWLDAVDALIERLTPRCELVVVSLGVDAGELDPIGDLGVTSAGFAAAGARFATTGLPVVVLQEGGYRLDTVADHVAAFLGPLTPDRAAGRG